MLVSLSSVAQALEALDVAAKELQELTRPGTLKVWVEKLNFRAWPGTEAPIVFSLTKDEQLKYRYQRTVRQESHTYGNQSYLDSWLLVSARGETGWIHGGGVVGVPTGLAELFNTTAPEANKRMRSDEPHFTDQMGADKGTENGDFLIVPGERIGTITLKTSEDQLLRQHGADVSRGKVEKVPGEFSDCTILYENEKNELRITWKDDTRTQVKAVYLERAGSKWHLKEGIFVGQSLSDVSKLNRAPVKFFGLSGRYAGVTESFSGGGLQPILKHGYLVIGAQGAVPSSLKSSQVFVSSQKEVAERDLRVKRMVVYLD
jgi:hypothetical protein